MRHGLRIVIIQCVHLEDRKVGRDGSHGGAYFLLETLRARALRADSESDATPYSFSWIPVDLKRQDRPIHRNRCFLIDTVQVNVSHHADNLSPVFHPANLLAQRIRGIGPILAREVLGYHDYWRLIVDVIPGILATCDERCSLGFEKTRCQEPKPGARGNFAGTIDTALERDRLPPKTTVHGKIPGNTH